MANDLSTTEESYSATEEGSPIARKAHVVEDSITATNSYTIGDLEEASSNLLDSGLYSDLTISCETRTWRVHRAILAQRCPKLLEVESGNHLPENVIVKDKNPEAVEIMLRYLYTLSDCLNIDSIDRISFMQDEDIYAKLPRECEQLGCVLSVASRYGLKVLAETASERLKERFELLKSHSPPDREALEPLTRSLLEVLYSNKDTSVLQTSRDSIVRMLLDQWRHLVPGDMIHTVMLRHPELGYDFARLAMEKIEYQQELMGRMQEDIPQKKRKAWISRRK